MSTISHIYSSRSLLISLPNGRCRYLVLMPLDSLEKIVSNLKSDACSRSGSIELPKKCQFQLRPLTFLLLDSSLCNIQLEWEDEFSVSESSSKCGEILNERPKSSSWSEESRLRSLSRSWEDRRDGFPRDRKDLNERDIGKEPWKHWTEPGRDLWLGL